MTFRLVSCDFLLTRKSMRLFFDVVLCVTAIGCVSAGFVCGAKTVSSPVTE